MTRKIDKSILQYAKDMGFKNQKDFKNHIIAKKEERLNNKPFIYETNIRKRMLENDRQYKPILKFLCPVIEVKSTHSSYVYDFELNAGWITYAKSARCKDLKYYNVSYYRVGNQLYSKTYYRNKDILKTLELPKDWRNFLINHGGLLKNEIGLLKHGILIRYNYKLKKTGIAIQLENPFEPNTKYWEHGKDIKDCLAQRDLKIEASKQKLIDEKLKRKSYLISLLCNNLRVTFQDSLDCGNCLQGTINFVSNNFPEKMPTIENGRIINNKSVFLYQLKRVPDNSNVKRLINYVGDTVAQLV